jgi:MFS family permease
MTHAGQAIRATEKAELTVSHDTVVRYSLAIVSAAAAVIHFAVAGAHFQEYWLFGVFMLAVAWLQVLWTVAAARRSSALLLWGGAVVNAGVVAVYIVTRTVGDVIGPTPHEVESLGFGDGLCTVLEAVIVAGCARLLLTRVHRRVSRRGLVTASVITAVVTAFLLNVALVAGGPEMLMTSAAAHGAAPPSQAA